MIHDVSRLLVLVGETNDLDPLTRLVLGGEGTLLATSIVGDQRIRARDDVAGRTEVLPERNRLRTGVMRLEIEDVPNVGPPPCVDGLVGITHDEEVAVTARDGVGDHELGVVGVLVLVDEDVAVALLQRGANPVVMSHETGGMPEEVVEVDRMILLENPLVRGVDAGRGPTVEVGGRAGEVLGRLQRVFRGAHLTEHRSRRPVARVESDLLERPLHRRDLVGRVVDGIVRGDSRIHRVVSQQPCAETVKGGDRESATTGKVRGKKSIDALAHLAGGLVGEGHREDLPRWNPQRDEVGDSTGDDSGLSRSWSGEHQHRSVDVRRRLALGVGQVGQQHVVIEGHTASLRGHLEA